MWEWAEGFFTFWVFEEKPTANCSQITRRHGVKKRSVLSCLPAQTVTRQRAEHEKWRDCIYPAYSAPAHVQFFFFFPALSVESSNNTQRKNTVGHERKHWDMTTTPNPLPALLFLVAFGPRHIIFNSFVDYFVKFFIWSGIIAQFSTARGFIWPAVQNQSDTKQRFATVLLDKVNHYINHQNNWWFNLMQVISCINRLIVTVWMFCLGWSQTDVKELN